VTASPLVLALDIGSTSVKAIVVGPDGEVVASGDAPHETIRAAGGQVEQDPAAWWAGCARAIAMCGSSARSVGAIAVTGQMQDLIAIASDGPIGNAVLYSDTRATTEHGRLTAQLSRTWSEAVGAEPDATNVAAKYLWLRDHGYAVGPHLLFGSHSVVVQAMTGALVCDPTTAATTALFDLRTRSWWQPVLDAASIDRASLPRLCASDEVLAPLLTRAAAQLGLVEGTPVVHAAGDAVATTMGVVGDAFDAPYAYLGTTGWVAVLTEQRGDAPGVIVLPAVGNAWLAVAPILSAGATVDWVRTAVLGDISFADMDRLAAPVSAAADGLVMLPHLAGSRAPHPDPASAGVYVGLRPNTGRGQIAAAAYEGVAHALRQIAGVLGVSADRDLAVCGGGARSDVWCQAIADVMGRTVIARDDTHATLLGAAQCAWRGLGVTATLGSVRSDRRFEPDPGRFTVHRRLAPTIDALAPVLSSAFAALAVPNPNHPREHT
jgi:xylulokinase